MHDAGEGDQLHRELETVDQPKDPRDVLPTRYEGLQGLSWTTANELDAIASRLDCRSRMLEVGTACGVTAAVLADRVLPVSIVCVDTFVQAERAEDAAIMAEAEPNRLEYWRSNARPCMRLWFGDLGSLSQVSVPATFDLALVDADHTHPHVLSDLVLASRLLKPEGWLLAHDYRDPTWVDVTASVDHFCRTFGWVIVDIVGSIAFMRRNEWSR